MKKTFALRELDCAMCAAKVEKAVQAVPGVQSATVNFVLQKLTLEADDAAFDEVLARVRKAVPRAERGCEVL
ncbi:MAG: cation transporter [Candidatus Limiplasma sp.]|nr:cation transporter [Candidatus Limiplasma sp.]